MQLTNELNKSDSIEQAKKIVKAAKTITKLFKGKNMQIDGLGISKEINMEVPHEVAKSEEFDTFVDSNLSAVNEIIVETQKKLNFFQKIKRFFIGLRQKRLTAGVSEIEESPAKIAKERMKKVLEADEATFANELANEKVIIPQNLDFAKAQVFENTSDKVETIKYISEEQKAENKQEEQKNDSEHKENNSEKDNGDNSLYGHVMIKIDEQSADKIVEYCKNNNVPLTVDKKDMKIILSTGKIKKVDDELLGSTEIIVTGHGGNIFLNGLSVKLDDSIKDLYKLKGTPCIITEFKEVNGMTGTAKDAEQIEFSETEHSEPISGDVLYSLYNNELIYTNEDYDEILKEARRKRQTALAEVKSNRKENEAKKQNVDTKPENRTKSNQTKGYKKISSDWDI